MDKMMPGTLPWGAHRGRDRDGDNLIVLPHALAGGGGGVSLYRYKNLAVPVPLIDSCCGQSYPVRRE